MTKNFDIKEAIAQYEIVFDKLNERYFENELKRPIITIQMDAKKSAYGWCTNYQAWKTNEEDEGYYEINLCAEHLNRSTTEICSTLFHEMIHLKNCQDGVIDCTAGQYHNKKFKDTAEKYGLIVEKTNKGYSKTTMNDEQITFCETLDLIEFKFKRNTPSKKKTSKKGYKYQCPTCGSSFWSTKELHVHCEDCDEDFKVVN